MVLKSRSSYQERLFQKDLNLIKNIIKKNGYYFSKIDTSLIAIDFFTLNTNNI